MKENYIEVSKRCEKWNRVFLIIIIASLFMATYAQAIFFSGQNALLLLLQKTVPTLFVFSLLFTLGEAAMIFNLYRYMPKEHSGIRLLLMALMVLEFATLIVRQFIDPFGPCQVVTPIVYRLLNIVMIVVAVYSWVKFAGRLRTFGIFILVIMLYNFFGTFIHYLFPSDDVVLYKMFSMGVLPPEDHPICTSQAHHGGEGVVVRFRRMVIQLIVRKLRFQIVSSGKAGGQG